MGISEDELANALIESHRETEEKLREIDGSSLKHRVYPEAHYNHYGTRGVADLYLTEGSSSGHLYELKSESAIRQDTGANAVIRQFNKMGEYFFEGSDHSVPKNYLTFELCFTPSEFAIRHLAENGGLYSSLPEKTFGFESVVDRVSTQICMRHPDDVQPIIFYSVNLDMREGIISSPDSSFAEYAETANGAIFEEFGDVIREISDNSS